MRGALAPVRASSAAPRVLSCLRPAATLSSSRDILTVGESLRLRVAPAPLPGVVEARRHIFGTIIGKVASAGSPEQLHRKHTERKLLGWSPEQLYSVVVDVDNYKEFVPWCEDSRVIKREAGVMEAELSIGFKVFVEKYISRVQFDPNRAVKATSLNSMLFHHLINEWKFEPGPYPNTCQLSFLVDFEFRSPLYSQLVQVFFDEVARRIVSAFEERVRVVYGPPVPTLLRRPAVAHAAASHRHDHGHGRRHT